jgi:SOS response regulatory protein OraA/RecX
MTREDATIIVGNIPINEGDDCYTIAEYQEAKAMAIKALKQVEVLDKMRAEIDRQQKWLLYAGYTACNVDIALDAIKSVVAESEG